MCLRLLYPRLHQFKKMTERQSPWQILDGSWLIDKKINGKQIVTAQHDELRNFLTEPLNDESTDVWLKIQSHRFFPFRILLAAPRTLKLRT